MDKIKLAILASHRGSNAIALIKASLDRNYPAEVSLVVSDNSNAPVLKKARNLGIRAIFLDPGPKKTFMTPEVEANWTKILKEHRIDYILLAGFMRVIKKTLLDAFTGRIINIHPSLLPSFKGLNAQRQAWEYGVQYTGATVHFVDSSLDSGPIILQGIVEVRPNDTPETLTERILETEHRIYPQAVKLLAEKRITIQGRRVIIRKEAND